MSLADAEARRRIAEDLDATLVVEAAAGTGKTTALVGRMVALIIEGRARLSEIVAVTFTEKAAGELKLRLRGEIERAREGDRDEKRQLRLEAALAELEVARIGTIHSFCADLLRERPIEAGVDPAFEVAAEEQEAALVERAFSRWLEDALRDPPEGVRRLLRRVRFGRSGPREQLLRASQQLIAHRDHATPWERRPFERDARIDEVVEALRGLAALARLSRNPSSGLAQDLSRFARFVDELDARERVRARDHDGLESSLAALRREKCWNRRGMGTWYAEGILRQDALGRRDAVREGLDALLRDAGADLAACLQRDLWPVVSSYEALKARTGTLDFLDLLIRARDLVREQGEVREELRSRIRAIFVDEFQDTDPLQAELLILLSSEGELGAHGPLADDAPPPVPGKLFVVGDPKQSIYRFRRADVSLYERLKERLRKHGVPVLELTTSFRATPSIQRVVNRSFVSHMQGTEDASQAHYVPLSEHRAAPADRPEVIALPVPRPYGRYGKVWRNAAHSSYADAVGAFVSWLIEESGWTIEDPHSRAKRRIESRDVCLLFRQMAGFGADLCRPYVLALEARDVPHVLVGGRAFHDREEVTALATALRAIEHPSDALSIYATLRGPFFALSDEQLLLHRSTVGPLHPLSPTYAGALWGDDKAVPEALDALRQLHLERNRAPIAETIAMFLDLVRAHVGIAHWPNGEQALANVLRVMVLARRFEAQGGLSFRAFIERLEDQLDRGEGVSAPVVEERSAGVRVMTVHRAKGLEFPVVVLCDPLLPRVQQDPSRWSDPTRGLWVAPLAGCVPQELVAHREEVLRADEAEEIRLAYVAATRARDVLVVPAFGDGREPGWVDPLYAAIHPEPGTRPSGAPGCPAFGRDTVLERPIDVSVPVHSVAPGLYEIEGARVVWWDPSVLALGRMPSGGLRRHGLLGRGTDSDEGARRIGEHARWVDAREALLSRAAERSVRTKPVTALAQELMGASMLPRIEETAVERNARPGGTRFGTLVHATLAEIELDAGEAAVRALIGHFALLCVAPDEERRAAVDAVVAALAHPIFAAARSADELRRESPIMLRVGDELVEGVIDLVFRASGRWTIVDFKTDRERGDKGQYAAQLELYARAVTAATGEPAETVLFYV